MISRSEILLSVIDILRPFVKPMPSAIMTSAHLADDLGINSARLVDIVVELEDRFGIKISDSDMEGLLTVGDTVNTVDRYMQESIAANIPGTD